MPWVPVAEPFCAPPRLSQVRPSDQWSPPLDVDRGWAEFAGMSVADCDVGLDDCEEFVVSDSVITDTNFAPGPDTVAEIRHSTFAGSDLSGLDIRSMRGVRLTECRLSGADFSQASITDVLFEGCVFRLANLRMARFERVHFKDCAFDDVDMFESTLTDIDFSGSRLHAVNVDRTKAAKVDLRHAVELGIDRIGSLKGWLITEDQLPSLMHTLAFSVSLGIEQTGVS